MNRKIFRVLPLLLAALLLCAGSAPASGINYYALYDKVSLQSKEAITPIVDKILDFASLLEERGEESGCRIDILPFVYGSGFLRYNFRGLDLDTGFFVDLGKAGSAGVVADKMGRFLALAIDAAREHQAQPLLFIDGFDIGIMGQPVFRQAVEKDISKALGMNKEGRDPYYYVYNLTTPDEILIPNRLLKDTLPVSHNLKFNFLSDAVKYSMKEPQNLKKVTVQIFFLVELKGKRYAISPVYHRYYRIIIPQVTVFNCLFVQEKDAESIKSLLDKFPAELIKYEYLTQIFSGMFNTYLSNDRLKYVKRAHQVFDIVEELMPDVDRKRFTMILKKYLSSSEIAEAAYLYELPKIALDCMAEGGIWKRTSGSVTSHLQTLNASIERLAMDFPHAESYFFEYKKNNIKIIKLLKSGIVQNEEISGLLKKNEAIGYNIMQKLIEDSDVDYLFQTVNKTFAYNRIATSLMLVNRKKLPFKGSLGVVKD